MCAKMSEVCSCRQVNRPASSISENGKLGFRRSSDTQKRLMVRAAERIYESCAAYNLRYCSLQGLSSRSAVRNSIRDLFVLACFFIANTIVLLAIVFRATANVYAAVTIIVRAIKKKFVTKQEENEILQQLIQNDAEYVTSSEILSELPN